MIHQNYNDDRSLDITELPTDEYPMLTEASLALAQAATEPNAAAGASAGTKDEPVKAALSLTHLEAEVSRLHAKWQSIDEEFKNREALIARLNEEIAARDGTIGKLAEDLKGSAAAREIASQQLAAKDLEIAALGQEQRASDERIGALAKELAEANGKHSETLEALTRAASETERLNDLLLREQAAVASLGERNKQSLADHETLQSKFHDLEIYINGRHDRWAELNKELASLKESLRHKEDMLDSKDATVAGLDDEKRKLSASIHDLERQCAELAGRRKEREEAYDELQKKLAAQLAQTEQLRNEHASKAKEKELAVKNALDGQVEIESLERRIEERDAKIEALSAKIEQDKLALGELAAAKADLGRRVDELEKGSAARAEQIEALREDLRKSHEQQRVTHERVADLTAQLAATHDALDRRSREADRLTAERDAAQKDSARIRAELDALGAHAGELGKLRAEAAAEAKQLQAALTARNELVVKLETELRIKQTTADMLERSVGRIADLGASLAALDDRMNGNGKRGSNPPASPGLELVTTLAADDRLTAAAPPPNAGTESAAASLDDIVDVGERTNVEIWRKLVVTIDGQTVDYPISKRQMTIGRGHDNDIRVASHFISRVHAKIRTNGTATIIEDAGSKNGVLVNSERVLRRVLRNGDVVTLGDDLSMRFVDATH